MKPDPSVSHSRLATVTVTTPFLAMQGIRRADQTAMRADRTIGPQQRLKPFAGRFSAVEDRVFIPFAYESGIGTLL